MVAEDVDGLLRSKVTPEGQLGDEFTTHPTWKDGSVAAGILGEPGDHVTVIDVTESCNPWAGSTELMVGTPALVPAAVVMAELAVEHTSVPSQFFAIT